MFVLKNYTLVILFLSVILLLSSCTAPVKGSIDYYVQKAGDNGVEIRKAYDYFVAKNDSLQLEALLFLLQNMALHNYSEITLQDSNKVEIYFSIQDYPNYDSARAKLDSLDKIYGNLNWRLGKRYNDLETITSDLLISNIELTFEVWKNKPWSKDYSFSQLKEYILPYRGSNEPLSFWRKYFLGQFDHLSAEFDNATDLLKVASAINDTIKKSFVFDPIFYLHPSDQGLTQMLENGMGRCEDMANLAIYALRANGIAVSSDYTPYWADSGNNHAWNALILPDNSSIPFMGCEADPGNYNLRNRIAKVYRKMYSKQENPLLNNNIPLENVPPWLGSSNYLDVTEYYTPVSNVEINLDSSQYEDAEFAYLCVFNSGEWKPIQFGKIENNKVNFNAMGVDLCYLPALYENKKIIPLGSPFILSDTKQILYLNGDEGFTDQSLISVTKRINKNSTDNKETSFLTKGKKYLLYYWDNEWKLVGERTAEQEPLQFDKVPPHRLYWLVEKDSRKEERIFTYEDGRQIWW